MDIQHDFSALIISSQRLHLDRSNCLEIVVFKGYPKEVQTLADNLKSAKA
jgi:metal-responsive CopG/Arc/MetJ family transcriptional regulator